MPNALGIDPGSTESAFVEWDGAKVVASGITDNYLLLCRLKRTTPGPLVFIEQIRGYGLTVGNEVFDTCTWSGRFQEAVLNRSLSCTLVPRKEIVLHLCDNARAGDKEIRQALIDRIGPPGTKKQPGPTYGIAAHLWAALAVAVYGLDSQRGAVHREATLRGLPA